MPASVTDDKLTRSMSGGNPIVTTVSSPRSIGATTLSVVALTGWPTDRAVYFTTYKRLTSGAKDFSTVRSWKAIASGTTLGTLTIQSGSDDLAHAVGDYVEMGPTAAWAEGIYDWGTLEHDTTGHHKDVTAASLAVANTTTLKDVTITGNLSIANNADAAGWSPLGATPNTVTYNGNRNYSLVFNSTDLTSLVSNGMRLKTTRTVNAPTQCASLNGTTQFFSHTGATNMTFTDDFVVSAWVKLSNYQTAGQIIVSRYNGTSGWALQLNGSGQVQIVGYNGGAANFSYGQSYQSVPLNKWVRITAQLDMSTFTATTTTTYIMFDGVDVPTSVARAGTNPTALVQAGNLEIGSNNGGLLPFAGKIAQVAIYNAKVTQANISATISQGLTGSETSLISAWSLSNSLGDLAPSANSLTANGSATTTNADSPFGGQADGTISATLDYAEIISATFSTNTTLVVRACDLNTIATSGGISAVSYSTQARPYGYPGSSTVLGEVILQSTGTLSSGDVLGAAITITAPQSGCWVKCSVVTGYGGSAASSLITIVIREGTVVLGQQVLGLYNTSNAFVAAFDTQAFWATSGTHTYKLTLAASSGTVNHYADTNYITHLRAERAIV